MEVTGSVLGQYFAWSKVKEGKRQRNNIGGR